MEPLIKFIAMLGFRFSPRSGLKQRDHYDLIRGSLKLIGHQPEQRALIYLASLITLSAINLPHNYLRSLRMKSLFVLVFGLFMSVSIQAQSTKPPKETAMDRFLRYVKIDTQSAEDQNNGPEHREAV